MADDFKYDVFLGHSALDRDVARDIAEHLKADGVRIWFEGWEIEPRASITDQEKIVEEGLERSRVLVLCVSFNAFNSDWVRLEACTLRFRDPVNRERRFIPVRLDDFPLKGFLARSLCITWLQGSHEQEYMKLLEACREPVTAVESATMLVAVRLIELCHKPEVSVCTYAFSPDEKYIFSGGTDNMIRLWSLETGECQRVLVGHAGEVKSIAWSSNQSRALSGSADTTVRVWDLNSGQCSFVLNGHDDMVLSVAWSTDESLIISGSVDNKIRVWSIEKEQYVRVLEGHPAFVPNLQWSANQRRVLSGSDDGTVQLWDVQTERCLRVFEGHTASVHIVAWSADKQCALSGSEDKTVRVWDVETGRCLSVLEGHTGGVVGLAWSSDQQHVFSGDSSGAIRVWDLLESLTEARASRSVGPDLLAPAQQVQYTNAKVLLVGESGVGKTGLSKRLVSDDWQPSDSTVGAWATHWKLPVLPGDGVEREIWLWDFGGQADQRLIHQLYMDETALAVLVFDGQKDDVFETLGQWDRDLARASRKPFSKILVAGRVDAGGLRISRNQVENFKNERGYDDFLETSAKIPIGCDRLKQAVLDGIRWEDIPWRSSPLLFKRLKEEIIRLKDTGRVLVRFKDLRETLGLRLSGESARFTDTELKAVISLLASPGVVWELKFGSWVLLQPERINAYAQAVIQTMRADEHERGCIFEERVLSGDLIYHSSMARLESDEERFCLLAMHQTLVERGLCLREHTSKGTLLVFPSYYRRERPELVGHPAVLVSYRFNGFLDDIYATLVVRMHHTSSFQPDQLWRYAADFKTLTGRHLGVKLNRLSEGAGELEAYFDSGITIEEKIIFSKYIHEHLLQNARSVVRLRHYVCPFCGTPVGNREVAMRRLDEWLNNRPRQKGVANWVKRLGKADSPSIVCSECEKRVPLWDEMEQSFANPDVQERVRDLRRQSAIILDSESKERVLVGEVISVVALANQICREKKISDHGIDMEIEFKDDNQEATGQMILLQLKSGDSHLRKRQSDGAEIFTIKHERHARYWMAQKFPVLLLIRSSEGDIRWMEVRDFLRRESENGKRTVTQIVFEGERLDVMSVRLWREWVLGRDKTAGWS